MMMDADERDLVLYGPDGEVDTSEPAPLPESAERADWHLRKATLATERAASIRALFDAEIERLIARRDEAARPAENEAKWRLSAVEAWHRAAYAEDKSVGKTIKLPHGESRLRKSQAMTEVLDVEEFRAWASLQPAPDGSPERVKSLEDVLWPVKDPELSKAAVKKFLAMAEENAEPGATVRFVGASGEAARGIRARVLPDRFEWKGAR